MRGAHSYFLLLLLLAPLLQQVHPIIETLPLRGAYRKKPRPEFTLKNLWSGAFQSGYDAWHRENFGWRDSFVRIRNQKDYQLYNKVHAQKVVAGKENCLFEENYLVAWSGGDAIDEQQIRDMAGKLLAIQNGLKKRGKTFVLAMAPGKASYYPEFVPARYESARQRRNNSEAMAPVFQEFGINLIDYNHEFINRKKTSRYPLFGKPGIHWTNFGAALAMQEFVMLVEQLRGTNLADFHVRNLSLSKQFKLPDDDLVGLMNLMAPPSYPPLPIFEWKWESSGVNESPRLTVFADSFFQQFLSFGITPACFREVDYFYYNSLVWQSAKPSVKGWDPATTQSALTSVDASDVILILATEINYSALGFGYLDALHEHLQDPPEAE